MALKFKLDSLDGLDDATKALYKESGGKFVLNVDGFEDGDVAGLKKKVEDLLADNAKIKASLKEKDDGERAAADAARKAREEAAAKSGDLEALRKSADERVAQIGADKDAHYKPQLDKLSGTVQRLLVDNVAAGIARDLAVQGSDGLLIPHIQQRLRVEERDGEMVTVVVDAKGKASASTLDDLKKEFSANAAFAPVIAGSKASGGGAGGGGNKGGGATGQKTMKRGDFDALPQAEKDSFIKSGGTPTE